MAEKEWLRNIRDACAASGPLDGRHVAILDDAVTTVDELAWALTRAGCRCVDVWTLARTP